MLRCTVLASSWCTKIFILSRQLLPKILFEHALRVLTTAFLNSGSFQHFSISVVASSRRATAR
jgi:hypothetical protein